MARRLSLTDKKLRNIPRRLKAVARWSAEFEGYFPDDLVQQRRYRNWKIPVDTSLVEGRQATTAIRMECAQHLIDGVHRLINARPNNAIDCRVVAAICLPDMFSSEICIYTDMNYHRGHIHLADHEDVTAAKSLAAQWGLVLPTGIKERGVCFQTQDCDGQLYEVERWYFGEID